MDEDPPGWAIRLETKIDVAIAKIDGRVDQYAAQLDRQGKENEDHEARLRAIEAEHFVTASGMAGALAMVTAILGGLIVILDRLYG